MSHAMDISRITKVIMKNCPKKWKNDPFNRKNGRWSDVSKWESGILANTLLGLFRNRSRAHNAMVFGLNSAFCYENRYVLTMIILAILCQSISVAIYFKFK